MCNIKMRYIRCVCCITGTLDMCNRYNVLSYQLTLIKMRAKLACLNHCTVPFFKPRRRQLVLVLLYNIYTSTFVSAFFSIKTFS